MFHWLKTHQLKSLVAASVLSHGALSRTVIGLLVGLAVSFNAQGQTSTMTALTVSPAGPVAAKTTVTLTATVVAGVTPVNPGQVIFCVSATNPCSNTAVIGTSQLTSAGIATLKFVPGPGSQTYKAIFLGTPGATGTKYLTSTSASQALVVAPLPSTTTITSSGSAGNYTLTGTVTGAVSSVTSLSLQGGTVSFLDVTNSNSVLGTGTLGPATLAQSYLNATGSPLGVTGPLAVAEADFNGDGIVDLATVGSPASNNLSVFLGVGDGSFGPASLFTVGITSSGLASIAVGDFNGDGIADLAVTVNGSNNVSILLGSGSGSFVTGSPVPVGTAPCSVAAGDFNGDGIADLAVVNQGSNNVSILLGQGNGSFVASSTVSVGTGPVWVVTGDFNLDGIADLAVLNRTANTVTILLGAGDGSFAAASGSPVAIAGVTLSGILAGDFNGDGKPDLVVTSLLPGNYSVLLGNGNGTFSVGSPTSTGSSTRDFTVATGDFNGDGILDLAIVNRITAGGGVLILLGNGDGTFAAPTSVATGSLPQGIAVGDFNGSGTPDLAVANTSSNNVSILLNQITQTSTATLTGVSVPGPAKRDTQRRCQLCRGC